MESNIRGKEPEVSFRTSDFGYYIRRLKWIVVLFAAVFAVSGFEFTVLTYKPYYYATSSLIVNAKADKSPESYSIPTLDDITLARTLVPTYTLVLQSSRVMDYVREELELDIPASVLRTFVSLQAVEDTQVLYMKVTCPDRKLAIDISRAILKVAPRAFMDTVEIGSVRVIDTAFVVDAVPRNAKVKAIWGGIAGVVSGVSLIVIYGLLSGKAISSRDLESSLGLPVLGEIEHIRKKRRSGGLLITSPHIPKSCIEAYMAIGAITDRLSRERGIKKLLIAGAVKGEGRTHTAINLAAALANAGRSVLLIDCDLRNPSIARILDIHREDAVVFRGTEEPQEAYGCVVEVRPGFYVIPFADQFDRSRSLFLSEGFGRCIEEYSARFDYILYDSPALYPVTDALYLSGHADSVLMVIRQDKAPIKTIHRCVARLRLLGADVLGCVMNDTRYARVRSPYTRQYTYYRDFVFTGDRVAK